MSACPLVQQGKNADDTGCIYMIKTEGKWWQIKMNIFRLFISHRLLLKRDSPPSWWNMSLVFHLAATITKTTEIPHCESRRLVPAAKLESKWKSKKCRTQGSCTAFHCCSVETLSVPRVWMWHHNWVGSSLPRLAQWPGLRLKQIRTMKWNIYPLRLRSSWATKGNKHVHMIRLTRDCFRMCQFVNWGQSKHTLCICISMFYNSYSESKTAKHPDSYSFEQFLTQIQVAR